MDKGCMAELEKTNKLEGKTILLFSKKSNVYIRII